MIPGKKPMSLYVGDDTIQNGADIVFDKFGKSKYRHNAKTASRPKVSEVLQFLDKI